jgi:phosphoribosylformimino-5-aminoimidazole carboxamide ribotide isomerase
VRSSEVTFEVVPAIDLRGGRVVRLVEGDFGRETSYSEGPVATARAFAAAGATLVHVVDLDGARQGRPAHLAMIQRVIDALDDKCGIEVAGGLRTGDDVRAALDAGARRVVVGTAAIRDVRFANDLVARHGADQVVVALDVREGQVRGDAWSTGAGIEVDAALRALADVGVVVFEVTAIERDGTLEGPDVELLQRLVALNRGEIIASGGIRSIDDLRSLRDVGCAGAIVGRALYEATLDLREAIRVLSVEASPRNSS